MSIIHHSSSVPGKSTREVIVPSPTKGIADSGGHIAAIDGYAKTLQNCTFIHNRLELGRPGLSFSLYPAADTNISCGVDDSELTYSSRAQTASGIPADGYNGYAGGGHKVYRRYWNLATGNEYKTVYTGSLGVSNIVDMLMFNGDLIFIDNYTVLRYDNSHVFGCGSACDTITDEEATTDVNFSGTSQTVTWTASHSHYIKLLKMSAVLKKTGVISGNLSASIVVDGTTYTSNDVNVDVSVSAADYSVVDFIFTDVIEMGTVSDFTINSTDTNTVIDYISIAKNASSEFMISVNGTETPSGCQLAVFNGRLYIGGNKDTNKVWFSNYNNPDDYYTTSSDGTVTYGGTLTVDNDENSQSYGVFVHNNMVVLSGYSNNRFISLFFDDDHSLLHRISGARLGGNYSVSTPNAIFFISEASRIGMITQLPINDRVNVEWVSGAVDKALGGIDISFSGMITYNPKLNQIYVSKSNTSTIYCLNLPSGQWTTYYFGGIAINMMNGHRFSDHSGYEYTLGTAFSATDQGGSETMVPATVAIDVEVETHKLNFSRFSRYILKKFLWDIDNDGFSGDVTIERERAGTDKTVSITGGPPEAVSVRVKDTGVKFKLDNVTIDEFTTVGELVCMISKDGRSE